MLSGHRPPGTTVDSHLTLRLGFAPDSPDNWRDLERKEVPSQVSFFTALINSFKRDEEGQGLAEYALILALIAIVAIVALLFLGGAISSILSTVGTSI